MASERDHDLRNASDEVVDAVLAEFDGDPRAAIKALLHDIAVLAGDFETSVSKGFVRGDVPRLELKRRR